MTICKWASELVDYINTEAGGLQEDDELRYGVGEEWNHLPRHVYQFLASGFPQIQNPDVVLEHATVSLLRGAINDIASNCCLVCAHNMVACGSAWCEKCGGTASMHRRHGCMDTWLEKLSAWFFQAMDMVEEMYGSRYLLKDDPDFVVLIRWELLRSEDET